MSLAMLIGTAVVAVGSLVSSILHKSGKDKAGDVVDTIVGLIKRLLQVIGSTQDPVVKSQLLAQVRMHLDELDRLGTPQAAAAAASIRKEMTKNV